MDCGAPVVNMCCDQISCFPKLHVMNRNLVATEREQSAVSIDGNEEHSVVLCSLLSSVEAALRTPKKVPLDLD